MSLIDKLGKCDSTTLVLHATKDGKIEVASTLWSDTKKIMPNEVLEVRSIQGTLRISRKTRDRDEQDLPRTLADAELHADPVAVELDPVTGYTVEHPITAGHGELVDE